MFITLLYYFNGFYCIFFIDNVNTSTHLLYKLNQYKKGLEYLMKNYTVQKSTPVHLLSLLRHHYLWTMEHSELIISKCI